MVQCDTCGVDLPGGTTECPDCGTSLRDETTAAEHHREGTVDLDTDRTDPDETQMAREADSTASTATPDARTESTAPDETSAGGNTLAGRFWLNTLLSGILGFVFAVVIAAEFFPVYFLGIMAGAFAGGLFHRRGAGSGALVGGMSGVVATIPFVGMILVVSLTGMGGLIASGEPLLAELLQRDEVLVTVGAVSLLLIGSAFVANIVCGLVGGLIGGAVAGE